MMDGVLTHRSLYIQGSAGCVVVLTKTALIVALHDAGTHVGLCATVTEALADQIIANGS
jgi:hypothetical protein